MFNGLKKRVHSVLQEGRNLSENLSNTLLIRQHSSSTTPNTSPTSPTAAAIASTRSSSSASTVVCPLPASDAFPYGQLNVHAGVSRLAATELDWQQLHEAGAANAATADQLDAEIQQVRGVRGCIFISKPFKNRPSSAYVQIQRRAASIHTAVSDMVHSLQAVPTLCAQLSECGRQLADVRTLCERLDDSIFQLEDVILDCELHGRQLEMRVELGAHQDRKMGERFVRRKRLLTGNNNSYCLIFYDVKHIYILGCICQSCIKHVKKHSDGINCIHKRHWKL